MEDIVKGANRNVSPRQVEKKEKKSVQQLERVSSCEIQSFVLGAGKH